MRAEICFAMWTSDLFMKRSGRRLLDLMCLTDVLAYMMCMVKNLKMYTDYEKAVVENHQKHMNCR
jgi:hypothetical protein